MTDDHRSPAADPVASASAPSLHPDTLAAQALGWVEPTTRALSPPIHASTTYERAPDGTYPGGRSYTRDQNPTYEQAEALLARLEGGAGALLFASGMAAATTVLDTLPEGAHVITLERMYWTIRLWLQQLADKGRIRLDLVPNGDLDALQRALRPGDTKLVWVETPANPTCEITDLRATADLVHGAGARMVADGTASTPVLCRPIAHGADVVMHSATKQLSGHGDVLAGALVTAREDETWEAVRRERGYRGAVLGPFEAWLLLRGMRTLSLRVRATAENAMQVAKTMSTHARVEHVYYAGLEQHPGHAIAARQMDGGFGPFVSIQVKGGAEAARRVAGRLRVFKNATSLGGVESLVEHRAPVEGPGTPVPDDLLRLSIGIEHAADLVADLEQALD